jgi:hypothetical protein
MIYHSEVAGGRHNPVSRSDLLAPTHLWPKSPAK